MYEFDSGLAPIDLLTRRNSIARIRSWRAAQARHAPVRGAPGRGRAAQTRRSTPATVDADHANFFAQSDRKRVVFAILASSSRLRRSTSFAQVAVVTTRRPTSRFTHAGRVASDILTITVIRVRSSN